MHFSMLMVCSLFISTCISAGVAHDTLVQTPCGQKELAELAVGDTVVCCSSSNEECFTDVIRAEDNSSCDNDKVVLNTKIRKLGGFLLTGVIVYKSCQILGYASVGIAAGATLATGLATGGPAGLGAAYLTVLSSVPTAISTVESASLTIGTVASFIPGLP